jgi:NifU-like protein involved in Fe-S cluster formation
MTELSALYNDRILELAALIPPARRLERPDASASAHSKLCGSTITVDLALDGDRITDYAQTVKACLLGQAAASIVAAHIVGSTVEEIRRVAGEMRRMLKENGPPPGGKWADLAVLQPVREVKGRHASTLLAFEAILRALDAREAGAAKGEGAGSPAATAAPA